MTAPQDDQPETVALARADFDMLMTAVQAVTEDVSALCTLLGVTPHDGMAPQLVMSELVLPRVAMLVATQAHVDEAKASIAQGAARFGPGEHNPATGMTTVKVGQRIPGLLSGLQPASRAERRELERRRRA